MSGAVATASLTETRAVSDFLEFRAQQCALNQHSTITVGQGEIQNFIVQSGSTSGVEDPGSVA